VMFRHLYHRHDDDDKCAAKRRWMIPYGSREASSHPADEGGRPEIRRTGMRYTPTSTRS
jgi:hypothetical protein